MPVTLSLFISATREILPRNLLHGYDNGHATNLLHGFQRAIMHMTTVMQQCELMISFVITECYVLTNMYNIQKYTYNCCLYLLR